MTNNGELTAAEKILTILSLCLAIIVLFFVFTSVDQRLDNVIKIGECQKELPRNQYCVLVAVPEKELDKTNE